MRSKLASLEDAALSATPDFSQLMEPRLRSKLASLEDAALVGDARLVLPLLPLPEQLPLLQPAEPPRNVGRQRPLLGVLGPALADQLPQLLGPVAREGVPVAARHLTHRNCLLGWQRIRFGTLSFSTIVQLAREGLPVATRHLTNTSRLLRMNEWSHHPSHIKTDQM